MMECELSVYISYGSLKRNGKETYVVCRHSLKDTQQSRINDLRLLCEFVSNYSRYIWMKFL